jgi:hypothetical protein
MDVDYEDESIILDGITMDIEEVVRCTSGENRPMPEILAVLSRAGYTFVTESCERCMLRGKGQHDGSCFLRHGMACYDMLGSDIMISRVGNKMGSKRHTAMISDIKLILSIKNAHK